MMEYGIVMNPSANVGEEIQCLAAMRFLPQVDYLIHKESLDKFKSEHPVSAIINAWYMFRGDHFPPSDSIHPLCIRQSQGMPPHLYEAGLGMCRHA